MIISLSFASGWKVKLSLGGFLGNYGDLNSFVSYEEEWLKFNNETWAEFQKTSGFLSSYSAQKGNFKELKFTLPVALRVSRRMGSFDVFGEVSYFSASARTSTSYSYHLKFSDGSTSTVDYNYSPFELKASLVGLGFGAVKQVFARGRLRMNLEASLGFAYVNLSYLNKLTGRMSLGTYWLEVKDDFSMDGKGPGMYGYSGLEIPVLSKGRFSLNLRAGYFFLKVFSVKGDSSLNSSVSDSSGYSNQDSQAWSGEWFIKEVSVDTWWGKVTYRFPSNYRDDLGDGAKDLGGFSPVFHGPYFSLSAGYSF